ncbi:dihydrofolate reductase [Candidatus Kaiserbacteria bacterium]|nr:dihydrofolate reductase [Candidatus Kaiserbacteria bacterium]
MKKPQISIVAAIGNGRQWNGALGKDGKLLWHIPEDLKRFKELTLDHPIIMGRKTFESIVALLGRPLPRRTNIVVTRDVSWGYDGVIVAHSLEEAIDRAKEIDQEEIFIGGGGEIYKAALPYVDKLYMTLVDDDKEGDSYFPPYEDQFTKKISGKEQKWGDITYRWVDLARE